MPAPRASARRHRRPHDAQRRRPAHQDGHSLLNAIAFPTVRAYDPAYAYEMAVIIFDGMKRMYEDNETAIYYITLENENYEMPEMPAGGEEGIIRGMYKLSSVEATAASTACNSSAAARSCAGARGPEDPRREVQHLQRRLERHQLQRAAPRRPGVRTLEHAPSRRSRRACRTSSRSSPARGPVIAATDYVRLCPSKSSVGPRRPVRPRHRRHGPQRKPRRLRRHFEVDAECIVARHALPADASKASTTASAWRKHQRPGHRPGKEIGALRVKK